MGPGMTPNGPWKRRFCPWIKMGPLMPKFIGNAMEILSRFLHFFLFSYFWWSVQVFVKLQDHQKQVQDLSKGTHLNVSPTYHLFQDLHISNGQLINASQKLRVQGIFDIFTASREWLALEGIFWSTTDLLSSCHCYATWCVLVDWVDRGMYLYKFMGYIHESYEQASIKMRICSSMCKNYWGATTKKEFRLRGV